MEDAEDREGALQAINRGLVRQALEHAAGHAMSRAQIDAVIEAAEYGLTHPDAWE